MRPAFRVYVDFDGTIALADTTDLLLERFADPAWTEVEAEWRSGAIGSAECLSRQVALLRVTPAELDAFVASMEIDPDFPAFVALAGALGLPVAVVSDGLDLVVRGVLAKAGITLPSFANRLQWAGGDRWSLAFPYEDAGCRSAAGHCKCRSLALDDARAVLVGDGRSDHCASGEASFVFARAGLIAHCRSTGAPHQPFARFGDLIPRFERYFRSRGWPVGDEHATTADAFGEIPA